MKPILIWAFMLVSMVALGQNCKWGLSPPNNQATCGVVEQAAASRMIRAKTICYSGDSRVLWSRNEKHFTPNRSFRNMELAQNVSTGYVRVYACERADLVANMTSDHTDLTAGTVSLEVTDADSGDVVFKEERGLTDEANDLYRLVLHFREARTQAKSQLQQAALAAKATADEKANYDEIHHLTLGVLLFPKTMSQDERSARIAKMELANDESRIKDEEDYLKVREETLSKKAADLSTRLNAFNLRKKVYDSNVSNFNQRCAKGGYLCDPERYTLNKEYDSMSAAGIVLGDEFEKFEQERKDVSQREGNAREARHALDVKRASLGMDSQSK